MQNIVAQVWRRLIMKITLHNKIFGLLRRQDLPCLLRLLSRLANPSQVTPPWRRLGDVNAGRWQEVSESGTGWLQARRATVPRAAQVLGPRTLHLPADPGPGKPQPPNNQYPSFLMEYFLLNQHVTPDHPKYVFQDLFQNECQQHNLYQLENDANILDLRVQDVSLDCPKAIQKLSRSLSDCQSLTRTVKF